MKAVLTGDIVNSTLLDTATDRQLVDKLRNLLADHPHEFFRGDSFQALVYNAAQALKTAMLCRTAALSLLSEELPVRADLRISIGIGEAEDQPATLATAKGQAFVMSGRALDALGKSDGSIIIVVENKLAGVGFAVMSDYINSIFAQMTQKQADVIHELLKGTTQQEVAEKLKKSKSTISQHASSARWEELEKILDNYEKIVQLVSL